MVGRWAAHRTLLARDFDSARRTIFEDMGLDSQTVGGATRGQDAQVSATNNVIGIGAVAASGRLA